MIVLINPNASVAMTDSMTRSARAIAGNLPLVGWTSHAGPPSIQGAEDGAAAVPPLLELVRKAGREGAAAIIIACFDDTGLEPARALVDCPVIGIGDAAYHLAATCGRRFSVVTTLAVSVPILEANIAAAGLAARCAKVRASGVEVLALERDPTAAARMVLQEIRRAEQEDGIDCIVLGCGGMHELPRLVREETGLIPVNAVQAAAAAAAALLREKAGARLEANA